MTNTIDIENKEEFSKLLEGSSPVVVKFWATWCGPCKQFAPHFEAAASQVEDAKFVSVDVDKAPWAMEDYAVMSVPTVLMIKDGAPVPLKARTAVQLINEINN